MSRLPIRLRLTLAFALVMTVVISGVGALLYVRLGDSLSEQIDNGLEAHAETLSALVRSGSNLSGEELASQDDEGFTQVVSQDGALLASSAVVVAQGPLLSRNELARARTESFFVQRDAPPGLDGAAARVLIEPVASEGQTLVLIVGASLEDRDEALEGLVTQLLIVGPLALVISSLAGYVLAAAALRPVEAMRGRAAEVSSARPGQRLPLPAARDEIHRLGDTLNVMLARLEAGAARERRFVADASHELRTPLALLQTELELALRRPRSAPDLEAALRSAAEEVDQLTRLAEDLLILGRIDEGELPLQRSTLSSGELLDTVTRRFATRAAVEGRAIEVVAAGDPPVAGDRLRLEQAIGNLVDNALRHGGGMIRLDATRREESIELSVSDDGAGFPPEFLPRAFERFSRADDARGGGAAGLGLAIVDAIARAHGGTAYAANREPHGAVVGLSLPAGDRPQA